MLIGLRRGSFISQSSVFASACFGGDRPPRLCNLVERLAFVFCNVVRECLVVMFGSNVAVVFVVCSSVALLFRLMPDHFAHFHCFQHFVVGQMPGECPNPQARTNE